MGHTRPSAGIKSPVWVASWACMRSRSTLKSRMSLSRSMREQSSDVLLALDRVGKDFGHFTAVREVSMRVRRGELKAIIGPNGAGKTTLFNLLSGELKPSRGSIYYRGEDITQLPVHALAH